MSTLTNSTTQPSKKTLVPGTPIPVGPMSWGVLVDEDNHTVYVTVRNAVIPVDTKTLIPGNPITLQYQSNKAVLNRKNHKLYVLGTDGGETCFITPIDTNTNKPGTPIEAGGIEPNSIALDEKNDTLYAADEDRIIVCIDMESGKPTPNSPIQLSFVPWDIAIDEGNDTLYALSREEGVFPISTNPPNTQGSPINAGYAPWCLVLDKTNRYLYVSSNDGIARIFTPNNTPEYPINTSLGAGISDMAIDEKYQILYLTDRDTGKVQAIDTSIFAPLGSASVGNSPQGVAVDQESHTVWVTSFNDGTVIPIQFEVTKMLIDAPKANATVPPGTVNFYGVGEPGASIHIQVMTVDKTHRLNFSTVVGSSGLWQTPITITLVQGSIVRLLGNLWVLLKHQVTRYTLLSPKR